MITCNEHYIIATLTIEYISAIWIITINIKNKSVKI